MEEQQLGKCLVASSLTCPHPRQFCGHQSLHSGNQMFWGKTPQPPPCLSDPASRDSLIGRLGGLVRIEDVDVVALEVDEERILDGRPTKAGLQRLSHPVILDGRTWSKLGEHGEHGEHREHGKDGKRQPQD